jgi:hypothetical protein
MILQYLADITSIVFLNKILWGMESNAPSASNEHTYTGYPLYNPDCDTIVGVVFHLTKQLPFIVNSNFIYN